MLNYLLDILAMNHNKDIYINGWLINLHSNYSN